MYVWLAFSLSPLFRCVWVCNRDTDRDGSYGWNWLYITYLNRWIVVVHFTSLCFEFSVLFGAQFLLPFSCSTLSPRCFTPIKQSRKKTNGETTAAIVNRLKRWDIFALSIPIRSFLLFSTNFFMFYFYFWSYKWQVNRKFQRQYIWLCVYVYAFYNCVYNLQPIKHTVMADRTSFFANSVFRSFIQMDGDDDEEREK